MRLSAIDLPLELLAARRGSRLVIFAGAGVSMPPPSSLLNFEALATAIAGNSLARTKDESPDYFLGRLEHMGIPVHERAACILSRQDSQPNELHRLLVEIFPRPEDLRIITTNFDLHLETELAARWRGSTIGIQAAPTLPVGSRFAGLVYVHGRLGGELVLTDENFGRAYLNEGWARRFLTQVFAAYDVLFVGYSHKDPIVHYLARGLEVTGDRRRFALTERGDAERWRRLGITPLEYAADDDHAALRVALREWVELEGRGPLGHERQVRELVARSPDALTEEEESYLLEYCLREASLAHFFYRHAEAHEPLSLRGKVARELAQSARCLSRRLWHRIANRVRQALDAEDVPEAAAENAAQWLGLLERHGNAASDHELIGHWLKRLSAERHTFLAVQVFTYLTRPWAIAEPSLVPGPDGGQARRTRPAVSIRAEHFWLKEYWGKLFAPNLHLFVHHLAPIVFAHLQQAHVLLSSQGAAMDRWDPLSFARAAIEPHEQNEHGGHDTFDLLIDAARDLLDWLICKEPETAQSYVEAGLKGASPLVRRLCIYGLAKLPQVSANRKIDWVIEERWLENVLLHHETFLLLRAAYRDSGTASRRRLIRAAERLYAARQPASPKSDKEIDAEAYELFDLLTWLERSDPGCPLLAKALGKLRLRHGELQLPEHPDLLHWSSGVQTVRTVSPLPPAEIRQLEPTGWVAELARIEQAEQQLFENPVIGFLGVTETAAARDLDWGLRLAEHLAADGQWDHRAWPYLLRAWADVALDEAEWETLLAFLWRNREIWRHAAEVAEVLYRRMERRQLPATAAMIAEGFKLAEALRGTLGRAPEEQGGGTNDWVQFSLNQAGGKLGLFGVHALARLYEIDKEGWTGIPLPYRPFLDRMAEAPPGSSTLCRTMLCSQLHFWFGIDAGWTQTTLFPRFAWEADPLAAQQAWHGFLTWGRPNRALMSAFIPLIVQAFAHLADLGGKRQRFAEYLAWIAYGSAEDPLDAGWIDEFLRRAEPADRRAWAQAIRSVLSDLEMEERHRLWGAWLRRYLERRPEMGVPVQDDEWAEVVHWSLALASVLPEVVKVLRKVPAGRASRDSYLYYRLAESDEAMQQSEALADLVGYLLAAATYPFHDCEHVAAIVRKLLQHGASRPTLRALAVRLAELGCDEAQGLAEEIERGGAEPEVT
jgi:Domain of unknown function (DUF4020)/SIR2-like domain